MAEVQAQPEPMETDQQVEMELVPQVSATPLLQEHTGGQVDRDVSMEIDNQLNMVSEPSTGSPVSTQGNADDLSTGITSSSSGSLAAKSSSASVLHQGVVAQNSEEVTAKLQVAERPKTPESERPMETRVRAKPSAESTVDMSPTATVSRRTGQHARIRPTTIHGEPRTSNSYAYPTPVYHEPLPAPKSRQTPSRENAHLSPPKVYHQSHFQQSSPSLLQQGQKLSQAEPVPPVPTIRQVQNGEATVGYNSIPVPPIPATPSVHDKTHRKGPSSSGRLFGFLGHLSKKNGESTTTVSSTSPKSSQDSNGAAGLDAHQQSATPPNAPSATSSKKPGSINQVFNRYSQHVPQPEKAAQSQKGKRRKTLSLIGGSNEHHQHQINGGARPPVPSSEGTAQRIMGWLRRKSFGKRIDSKMKPTVQPACTLVINTISGFDFEFSQTRFGKTSIGSQGVFTYRCSHDGAQRSFASPRYRVSQSGDRVKPKQQHSRRPSAKCSASSYVYFDRYDRDSGCCRSR